MCNKILCGVNFITPSCSTCTDCEVIKKKYVIQTMIQIMHLNLWSIYRSIYSRANYAEHKWVFTLCRELCTHRTSAKQSTEHDLERWAEGSAHFSMAACHGSKFSPPLQVSWGRDGAMGIADKASWRTERLGEGGGGGGLQLLYIWQEEPSKRKRLDVRCRCFHIFIVPAQFTGCWRRRCDERAVCCEA